MHAISINLGTWHTAFYNYNWLCLVTENRYLQCDGEREVGVLDGNGGLTVGELGGWNCIKCLKGGGMAKRVGKQKFKNGYMFGEVVGALEKGGL